MDSNSNIASNWAGFRKLWIIVAIVLFLLLLILMLVGYGPWGTKCDVPPTIVEKVVVKEKLVDNPELLSKISVLEKENAEIEGLKTTVTDLTKSSGLVTGLQAKVKTLEAIDLNFENPALTSRIKLLETENASISDMKSRIIELEAAANDVKDANETDNLALTKRIGELETENGLIAGLKAKVFALEAIDINFMKLKDSSEGKDDGALMKRIAELETENGLIAGLKAKVSALEAVDINFKPQDDSKLLQKINNLEIKTLTIPSLESRIESLQSEKPVLTERIAGLEKENGLIAGLKAKITALEAVDINFTKPQDNSKLLQKINNLEVKTLAIPSLESHIESLQSEKPVLTQRIGDLEKENALIAGLKAKIEALEAIDINFITNGSAKTDNSANNNGANSSSLMMAVPNAAKLYFLPGSSRSPADMNQSMADVIAYLRSNPSSKVSLAGFHDAAGNANWNRRLATKRSNRVKQLLVGAGVDASRISVEVPTQTLGTGSPEEARRVEVQVSN